MPFVKAARKALQSLDSQSSNYAILTFLIDNAVGRSNAKTWNAIKQHLLDRGLKANKNQFQHNLLSESRSWQSDVFIASSRQGYFIIRDRDDAAAMVDWYNARIQAEEVHRERLGQHINKHWPDLGD